MVEAGWRRARPLPTTGRAGGGRGARRRRPAGEVRHIQKKVNRACGGRRCGRPIVLAVLLGCARGQPLVSSLYYQPNAYTVGGMEIARRTLLWRRTA